MMYTYLFVAIPLYVPLYLCMFMYNHIMYDCTLLSVYLFMYIPLYVCIPLYVDMLCS